MMSIFKVFLDVANLVTFQHRAPPSARHRFCRQEESNKATRNAKQASDEIDSSSNDPKPTIRSEFLDF